MPPSIEATAPGTVRVLLADDHQLFLEGLRALLGEQPGLLVVGEAANGRQAVAAARSLEPNIVVMDLSMPGMNGIEATRRIVRELPDVKVICLSMHSEARFVEAALEAGAAGYLLKDCASDELLAAVETVSGGKTYISPSIASLVVTALRSRERQSTAFTLLTQREREVLQLLAEGHSTKQIAAHLGVSIKTVGTHREHIMQKLDIHSIAGLTKYAIGEGLTSAVPRNLP